MIDFFGHNLKLVVIFILVLIATISAKIMRRTARKTREKRNKILSRLRREEDE